MTEQRKMQTWLPVSQKETAQRGWDELDVVLFSGDAYVDHPSFGIAVIGRVLEKLGLRVAIVPQPNWQDDLRDFRKFGRPRLFFGISAGNMDSMVNHYTANKRLRSDDAYTPGGKAGFRPDYATRVYSSILRKMFPDVPVVIGGIEASLRRITHYDYWSDSVKPSILVDSGAHLLVYGMGEQAITEIAKRLLAGESIDQLSDIRQTAYLSSTINSKIEISDATQLPSHEECCKSKPKFAEAFRIFEQESNKYNAKHLVQACGTAQVVVNPPFDPLSQPDLDAVYDLPFTRLPHPKYLKKGAIPAYDMIKFSVNIHRGCFGGCSFCTISAHQGKFIASRSSQSILTEIKKITLLPDFAGHLSDLGGPSANMYRMAGKDTAICKQCKRYSCIHPAICKNLNTDHQALTTLYKQVRSIAGIKKVTIGSGIRYDLLLDNRPDTRQYVSDLVRYHVSGRLKVAPEHTCPEVLMAMRKPSFDLFKQFYQSFTSINQQAGLNQQLVPYFISSHPTCSQQHMQELALQAKQLNLRPEQVQDFTPTPLTLATTMYYTGIDPYTGKAVFVARSKDEKLQQKDAFFFWKPTNQANKGKDKR